MRTLMMVGEPFHEVSDKTAEKIMALVEAEIKDQIKAEEKPKPYQFQAGDVVESENGYKRTIVRVGVALVSFDSSGVEQSTGQSGFERYGYKKIGVIGDFIK